MAARPGKRLAAGVIGNAVHSNELIRSGDAAVAELVFIDQTKVSVGPKSEIRLDKFVYNPNNGSGAVVLETSRGAYRFITGVQEHKNYEIKTPYATLGVRGTIIEINLEGIEEQDQVNDADGSHPNRRYFRGSQKLTSRQRLALQTLGVWARNASIANCQLNSGKAHRTGNVSFR